LLRYNPSRRFSEDLLKAGIQMVLLAPDYLHTECKSVHTGSRSLSDTSWVCSLLMVFPCRH
jgi:hypothetical protein